MLMRADSRTLKVLMFLSSPVPWLPSLFPLWVEHARVGNDYSTFVKVTLRTK